MISVIIPCYNCAAFVRRAIESVLDQTFRDYELLLIDNRSTDGALHILNQYQERFPNRIRVYHEDKKGAPAARNKGLSEAKGEWVQFLDADDELLPEKMKHQLAIVEGMGAGLVAGSYRIEANKGNKKVRLNKYTSTEAWEGLIRSNLGLTSSNLWKREALLSVGGWDETRSSSQEYDLMFRLLKTGIEVVFDDRILTVVHEMPDSVSKSSNKKRLTEIVQNRIKLRYEIKDYLHEQQHLTRKLNRIVDTYVYYELKRNSSKLPDYTAEFMKQRSFDVSLDFVLRLNARLIAKRILNL